MISITTSFVFSIKNVGRWVFDPPEADPPAADLLAAGEFDVL